MSLAAAVIAVVCCAGLPVLGAAVGGVTLGALVGVGGGLVALVAALVVVLALRASRRGGGTSGDPQ